MPIEVSCDCAMTYRLPDRYAGKRCRCRECGESIRVPAPASESESDSADDRGRADRDDGDDRRRSDRLRGDRVDSDRREPRRDADRTKKTTGEKKTEKPALRAQKLGSEPKLSAERKARAAHRPSESLHQMQPLNLSESRPIEPPRARARAKAQASASAPRETKRTKAERRSKPKQEKSSRERGDKGTAKGRARTETSRTERPEKSRDKDKRGRDRDEPERSDRSRGGASSKGRRGREQDEDEEQEERLSPRELKRRQQNKILLLSFVAVLLGVGAFVVMMLLTNGAEKAAQDALAAAKDKVSAAEKAASAEDWENAKTLFQKAIAFVEAPPAPIEDHDFRDQFKLFKQELPFIDQIIDARKKLDAKDLHGAFDEYWDLMRVQNDMVLTAALKGLDQTGDDRAIEAFKDYVNYGSAQVKNAALLGLVHLGSGDIDLASVIQQPDTDATLRSAAIDKATAPNAPPATLASVLQKVTDADVLIKALSEVKRRHLSNAKDAVLKLTSSSNDGVKTAAQAALAAL